MAKVFGINTKIRGKVGEYIYRQTKVGTVVSEAPVKPITPLRTQRQMSIRTQWARQSCTCSSCISCWLY